MDTIAVVSQQRSMFETVRHTLSGHRVLMLSPVLMCDRIRGAKPSVVLMDLDVAADALRTLVRLAEDPASPPVVAMTSTANPREIVNAMRCGAADVISAPPRPGDIQEAVFRALSLVRTSSTCPEESELHPALQTIVGVSPSISRLRAEICRVAGNDAGVLVTGESGVGKELVASAIHALSPRNNGPFQVRNCGAIPEPLFESEMFGTEPGAYTGARRRPGGFELADKGTLFLDEVGELSPSNQVKLLRVLEDGAFYRVGGISQRTADCRIVAATNRDLHEAMQNGEFRSDLYYRLNVLQITVPPLRERLEDIPHLVRHFTEPAAGEQERIFTTRAMLRLTDHRWPGNIRELRNTVQRAVYCAEKTPISENEIRFG